MDRRSSIIHSALALLPLGLACAIPAGKLGDVASDDEISGGEPTVPLPPESERLGVLEYDDRAVDILFVFDNSGTMGQHQVNATQSFVGFADVLSELGADVRFGMTTTDNGNPWCTGSGPEAGQLRLSPCTSRLSEFVFEGAIQVDVTEEACLDLCGLESLSTSPTTTHVDDVATPRPWIELGPGGTNLANAGYHDALSCSLPQGIDGCGFESPLESMHKALERTESPSDPSYGFLRPWARLVVVFVTDEVDCSVDSAWEELFLPDGNRVFWSDPSAPAPTSAVCWNAGVQCQNEDGDLGACNPQNYDLDGGTTDASSAVMFSLTRYIEDLEAIEARKAIFRPEDSVGVVVFSGVPPGYQGGDELVYTRGVSADPEFVIDFGVDPGCSSPDGPALPPVRLRALAELFTVGGQGMVSSLCDPDFGPTLDEVATAGLSQAETVGCVPGCVADVDSAVGGTQAQCDVIMSRAGAAERESVLLPSCGTSDASEICYELRLDDPESPCTGGGRNAELELVIPEGTTVRGRATVEVACEMAPADSC